MRRGTLIKTSILLSGLILIPLFSNLSKALYEHFDEKGNITISGNIKKTYKLYTLTNELTYKEVPNLKLDSSSSIEDQIRNHYESNVLNYVFTNNAYKDLSLNTKYSSLKEVPSSDIYLEYLSLVVKGSNDTSYNEISYDLNSKKFNEKIKISGQSLSIYKKLATKEVDTSTKFGEYNSLVTNSGYYDITCDLANNYNKVKRVINFYPSNNYLEGSATFSMDVYDGFNEIIDSKKVSNYYEFLLEPFANKFKVTRWNENHTTNWNRSGEFILNKNNYSKDKYNLKMDENINFGNDWNDGTYGIQWL